MNAWRTTAARCRPTDGLNEPKRSRRTVRGGEQGRGERGGPFSPKGGGLASRGQAALRVRGAQLHRELRSCLDPAFLGPAAPGLQVGGQLLARQAGVEPHLAQLFAHGDHLVQHRVRGTGLGDVLAGGGGHALFVAVQPALGGLQQWRGLALVLEHLDLGLAGPAHFAAVARHHLVAVGDQRLQRLLVGDRLDRAQAQLGRTFFTVARPIFCIRLI